jgi:hypothetical protein
MEDEAGVPVEPSPHLGVLVGGVVVEDVGSLASFRFPHV